MDFSEEVAAKIGWYVYRLIDPRNGETFYVGKGKGNRVFAHVRGALHPNADEDRLDLKTRRIQQIRNLGLEVGHVIHRHGLSTSTEAYLVEAAVMDAYPGLSNIVNGHGSNDFGCANAVELVRAYTAETFTPKEPLILISIGQSAENGDRSVYNSVRGFWKIKIANARKYKLVLAHVRGLVVGAYRPEQWLAATARNFPELSEDISDRCGFIGKEATEVKSLYVDHRVPDVFRPKGAANPIKYVDV